MGDVIAQTLADPVLAWHIILAVAVIVGWVQYAQRRVQDDLARVERKLDALLRHERLFEKLDSDGYPKPKEEIDKELLAAWNWAEPKRDEG